MPYARALQKHINSTFAEKGLENIQCDLWNDRGLFELSYTTIENLLNIAYKIKESDGFAILLFTPDDHTILNYGKKAEEKEAFTPRDNVVFELGLFTGVLKRDHTFCVAPSNIDNFRLFSDWQGVTNVRYIHKWRGWYDNKMKEVSDIIVSQILKKIVTPSSPPNLPDSIDNNIRINSISNNEIDNILGILAKRV